MAIRMLSLLFVAAALLVAPQLVRAEVFEGTIMNVVDGEVVILIGEEEKSFSIDSETSISLDGVAIDDLSQLGMGATATVAADMQEDDSWLATSILAQTSPLLSRETSSHRR